MKLFIKAKNGNRCYLKFQKTGKYPARADFNIISTKNNNDPMYEISRLTDDVTEQHVYGFEKGSKFSFLILASVLTIHDKMFNKMIDNLRKKSSFKFMFILGDKRNNLSVIVNNRKKMEFFLEKGIHTEELKIFSNDINLNTDNLDYIKENLLRSFCEILESRCANWDQKHVPNGDLTKLNKVFEIKYDVKKISRKKIFALKQNTDDGRSL